MGNVLSGGIDIPVDALGRICDLEPHSVIPVSVVRSLKLRRILASLEAVAYSSFRFAIASLWGRHATDFLADIVLNLVQRLHMALDHSDLLQLHLELVCVSRQLFQGFNFLLLFAALFV